MRALSQAPAISGGVVSAYEIPTGVPQSDGTLAWSATTLVLVQLEAGDQVGIGYSYANSATARLIQDTLLPLVTGSDSMAIEHTATEMTGALRNMGQTGISAMALAAVNNAQWDLKAKLLQTSVAGLLGGVRDRVPAYASGGFTSLTLPELQQQIEAWCEQGFRHIKIKVGSDPQQDIARVRAARAVMPPSVQLMVDANGAYSVKQALAMAEAFAEFQVSWFEEPVRSTDLAGLAMLRTRGPAGMFISAGEYGYDPNYFRRMLEAQAVDTLQADATRCKGVTGFMKASVLCEAFDIPLSSHCAPALHAHTCCAARPACHLEYFQDHVRLESRLFDGAPTVIDGMIGPDWERPGFGLEFRQADANQFAVQ